MLKNLVRALVAIWYLLGWVLHIYLGLFNPGAYQAFGTTALIPGFDRVWAGLIMPRIAVLALLLAVFEIAVGFLLLYRGRWVTLGLIVSILFNGFLVQLGLGFPAPDSGSDFYFNRLPNLVFVLVQIYLLLQSYPQPFWVWARELQVSEQAK